MQREIAFKGRQIGTMNPSGGWCYASAVWLGLLLGIAAAATPADAQFLVRQVGLAELSQQAGVIVHGRVIEVRRESHPDHSDFPTVLVTLEVLDNIRGAASERFSFRQYADEMRLYTSRPGEAPVPAGKYNKLGYTVGQELLLFLYANSRYGLTSPMGGGQGHFHVIKDGEGKRLVVNEFGNRGLFEDVAAAKGVRLTPEESRLLKQPAGAIELESFVSLVRRLAAVRSTP